jgi:hypothetical protein
MNSTVNLLILCIIVVLASTSGAQDLTEAVKTTIAETKKNYPDLTEKQCQQDAKKLSTNVRDQSTVELLAFDDELSACEILFLKGTTDYLGAEVSANREMLWRFRNITMINPGLSAHAALSLWHDAKDSDETTRAGGPPPLEHP